MTVIAVFNTSYLFTMKSLHLHIYQSPEDVAEEFAFFLKEKVEKKEGLFNWALSGGSTPKILFKYLAEHPLIGFPWEKLQIFWGDERCVPPTDSESNFKMTDETLLSKVPIPENQIHRVLGESDPEKEAIRYGQLIQEKIGGELPSFDLIMLGMGSDGHTASIFPHQMELLTDPQLCGVAQHPESGQYRVTLNGPLINAAKEVAFLVTGLGKKEKVYEVFREKEKAKVYPVSHIDAANRLHWFLDRDASATW